MGCWYGTLRISKTSGQTSSAWLAGPRNTIDYSPKLWANARGLDDDRAVGVGLSGRPSVGRPAGLAASGAGVRGCDCMGRSPAQPGERTADKRHDTRRRAVHRGLCKQLLGVKGIASLVAAGFLYRRQHRRILLSGESQPFTRRPGGARRAKKRGAGRRQTQAFKDRRPRYDAAERAADTDGRAGVDVGKSQRRGGRAVAVLSGRRIAGDAAVQNDQHAGLYDRL